MSKKVSSVRWVIDELAKFALGTSEFFSITAITNHADRMHKEEIMDAFQEGKWEGWENHDLKMKGKKYQWIDPGEYYNEKFGGDK